jgi:hypothetical protein
VGRTIDNPEDMSSGLSMVELNCAVPNCEDTILDIFTMQIYDNHIIMLN